MLSMKNTMPRLLAAALLILSPVAAAENNEPHLYVGISAGPAKFKDACAGVPVDCDDSDVGVKIYSGIMAGAFGVEIGITELGETKASGETMGGSIDLTLEHYASLIAAVVVRAPWESPIKPFAKIGGHRWRVESSGSATVQGRTNSLLDDDSGFDLMYGLGAQYDFEESEFSLRAEWERFHFGFKDDFADDDKADFISAGIVYRF